MHLAQDRVNGWASYSATAFRTMCPSAPWLAKRSRWSLWLSPRSVGPLTSR